MTQRNRKLIGGFALVASIVIWSILATGIYLTFPEGLPGLVLIAYFIIAGMGWIFPAMVLVRWMSRPDTPTQS